MLIIALLRCTLPKVDVTRNEVKSTYIYGYSHYRIGDDGVSVIITAIYSSGGHYG